MGMPVNQVPGARFNPANGSQGIFENIPDQGGLVTKIVAFTRPDFGDGTSSRAWNGSPGGRLPFEVINIFDEEANERFFNNSNSIERQIFIFSKITLRENKWKILSDKIAGGTVVTIKNSLNNNRKNQLSGTDFYTGTITEPIRFD